MDRHKNRSRSDSDDGSGILSVSGRENTKIRIDKRRKRSEYLYELKDMRKLDRNDEAFILTWMEIRDITAIIRSQRTPTPERYKQWDEYEASFYLKMCTCYGINPQHLEPEDENEKKRLLSAPTPFIIPAEMVFNFKLPMVSTGVEKAQPLKNDDKLPMVSTGVEKTQPLKKDERLESLMRLECTGMMPTRSGPLKTGCYSSGNEPDQIPYHLYLLIKEAVDIMKRNDLEELDTVEKKIRFFCTYFHSHLKPGFKYKRANASSLIADYDTTRSPKYRLTGYTPSGDLDSFNMDVKTQLTEQIMVDIMNIIHSRKKPNFSKWGWTLISFYCKICSCFGIDYQRIEDASDDDVCLMMNMGIVNTSF